MELTGQEFIGERGSRGHLLNWMWSKIYPKINSAIPESVQPVFEFSGSSWHYHCRFSSYGEGNGRIWDIKSFSTSQVENMATQVMGIDTNPVPFNPFVDMLTYKDYTRGFLFDGGQTYFIKFFEINAGIYKEVYTLKLVTF